MLDFLDQSILDGAKDGKNNISTSKRVQNIMGERNQGDLLATQQVTMMSRLAAGSPDTITNWTKEVDKFENRLQQEDKDNNYKDEHQSKSINDDL